MRLSSLVIAALTAASLALPTVVATPAAAQEPGALHAKDWFSLTFKDVREDLADAGAEGKRLVLLVEQYGCIYCAKLHDEVLSDPDVEAFVSENYMVVQLNLFGDEEVTDLDGETLSEREALRRWGIAFTPTMIFLPEDVAEDDTTVAEAAVQVMPGAFGKWTTLDMFRWVRIKGYEGEEHFQKFHARQIAKLRAEGRL